MQDPSRESWMDTFFWGVTIAMAVVAVGLASMFYFNWWEPLIR